MNKYKKLSLNVLSIAIGQFSSKLLVFFLLPLYTTLLTPEEYGVFDLLVTSVTLLTPIFTLTITEGVLRFCLDEKYDSREILSIGLLTVITGSIMLAFFYPVSKFIPSLSVYYSWFIIFFIITNIHSVFMQYIKGIGSIKFYSICGTVTTLTTLVLNILFLVVFRMNIKGYMMSYIVSHTVVDLLICLRIKIWRLLYIPKRISKKTFKDILNYSFPMIPNSLCWWISNSSDKYMISLMVSTSALGIYSVSYKIPSILTIFTTIFNSAFQISSVENFGDENSKKFYSNVYQLYSSINVIIAATIIVFGKTLAYILYRKEFFEAWKSSIVLIVAFVFNSLSALLGTIYTSAKKTKMLFYSTLLAAIINVMLNVILIPVCGIVGAAIATLFSYFIVWIIRLINSRSILKFKINILQNIISYVFLVVEIACLLFDFRGKILIAIIVYIAIIFVNVVLIYRLDAVKKYIFNRINRK